MILHRTVNAFLTRRMGLVRLKAAFLTHGTGLVRIKAGDSITRPFLSTSDGRNSQQEDELKGLKDEIAELKCELLTVVDPAEKTAIRDQISTCRKHIIAILQQGTFVSPTSVIFSRYLSITPLTHSLSTSHLLPFRFGDVAR